MKMAFISLTFVLAACTQDDVRNSIAGALQAGCRAARDCTVQGDAATPGPAP